MIVNPNSMIQHMIKIKNGLMTKYRWKQKYISLLTVEKWIIMNFKKLVLKIVCVIILMT